MRETEMDKTTGAKDFYQIIYSDLLLAINKAMLSLSKDFIAVSGETANGIIADKTEELKKIVDRYIDEQGTILQAIRCAEK